VLPVRVVGAFAAMLRWLCTSKARQKFALSVSSSPLGSRVSVPGTLQPTLTILPNPSLCDPVTYIPEAPLAGTQGDQLYDVICVCIHLAAVALLRRLNAGAMYFWIKDLTHEFLKLSIIYSSVEIMEKVTLASQLIGTIT